jgi:hypothetical protein
MSKKDEPFEGILKAFWIFLNGMSQGPFDPSQGPFDPSQGPFDPSPLLMWTVEELKPTSNHL